ncbi:FAD:protein FMN transferase [Conexibacter sp. JD483]|uniref:FAD:protein FMN transferase n=1 Tax=unclassified Conexibacter TaxID=2627773 RepID=UPI002726826C|nr:MULTISPECIES: FAD:protein FMN transferase [unclassified Conexibacter]MDO8188413.1 FAD:protein FMN transferase [Conexibacter sp. CPCC 205706]MDO8198200.1 FAD:protein FMN transferase [Conexibacter sp. CPCC 205762]MDR9370664.1 FAD:protein FMN transferase [Conexibacter sp. JD483]
MSAPATATASWRALGSTARLVVTDPRALPVARAAVERELAAFELACSRFRDDSELSTVNAAGGAPVAVSRTFAHAVAVALRVARATDGLVDPALGAALRRAGYDRDFDLLAAPADPASAPAGAGSERPRRPGDGAGSANDDAPASPARPAPADARAEIPRWRQVEVDELAGIVRVPAGVELDLGASAKALAADHAARAAQLRTGAGVLVALGGDVAIAGEAPDGGWTVRVRDDHRDVAAEADDAGAGETIAIRVGGLATSGTTVRRWVAGGELRHHVIDPRSGLPARTPWRTATVAAASCVDANAAATAALVRGADAPRWLAALGLPARLVARNGATLHVGAWPNPPRRAAGSAPRVRFTPLEGAA